MLCWLCSAWCLHAVLVPAGAGCSLVYTRESHCRTVQRRFRVNEINKKTMPSIGRSVLRRIVLVHNRRDLSLGI